MNLTISLPDGRGLGGVTTWAVGLAERFDIDGHDIRLIEHATSGRGVVPTVGVATVDLSDQRHPNHPFLSGSDIDGFRSAYSPGARSVFVPNWSWGSYAAATALVRDNPQRHQIVAMIHADGPDYYEWAEYYEAAVSAFVAVSNEIAHELQAKLPHRADDITVLPYAVDVPATPPVRPPNRPLEIVYAGRLALTQKRVLDLLAVATSLEARGVDFAMRIIGTGPDAALLDARIAEMASDVRQRIRREDARAPDAMPATWAASDVFLLTSDYEGTSIAMLEAMGQGSVPVVTNVSGVDAVIDHGVNGFVAPVGSIERLAGHIEALATTPGLLDDMRTATHRAASSRPGMADYDAEFAAVVAGVVARAADDPQRWPPDRPLLPKPSQRASRTDLARAAKGDRDAARRLAFFAGALPGVSGLRWAVPLAKRVLNRRAS